MSRVHSIEQALRDSATLAELAERAGVTPAEAERVAAQFAALDPRQVIRICVTAQTKEFRQRQRMFRKERSGSVR